MSSAPLEGIRVLDLSRVLAGPWACQHLADLGADVIKVERPGKGDESRIYGPPFLKDKDGKDTRESTMYLMANRNKRGITVDISKPEGQDIIRRLAAESDVLVENYKVGDLKRYGLDYESLARINPRLIYCSITGFGQTGPYRNRLGYDPIFQAMGGLMGVTGLPDDQPGGGPVKVGPSIADLLCAFYAVMAIQAALYHRDQRGGSGQYIDMALVDSVVPVVGQQVIHYMLSGDVPPRRGNGGNGGVPASAYKVADGSVYISASNDEQYRRMCTVLGREDLGTDERFLTQGGRMQHRAFLMNTVAELAKGWKQDELLAALEAADVPAAPIYNVKQVIEDPQIRERGLKIELPDERVPGGKLSVVGSPMRFSKTPVRAELAPPPIGAHTEEVLAERLKLDAAAIAALRAKGAI